MHWLRLLFYIVVVIFVFIWLIIRIRSIRSPYLETDKTLELNDGTKILISSKPLSGKARAYIEPSMLNTIENTLDVKKVLHKINPAQMIFDVATSSTENMTSTVTDYAKGAVSSTLNDLKDIYNRWTLEYTDVSPFITNGKTLYPYAVSKSTYASITWDGKGFKQLY